MDGRTDERSSGAIIWSIAVRPMRGDSEGGVRPPKLKNEQHENTSGISPQSMGDLAAHKITIFQWFSCKNTEKHGLKKGRRNYAF